MPVLVLANSANSLQSVKLFFKQFNQYYSDNFVFRERLIDLYCFIKKDIFSSEPFPGRAVHGTGGWLFLGDDQSHAIQESKGIKVYSEHELNQIVKNVVNIENRLDSMGIKFYIAIAPNKLTVYGRYLPILHSGKPTKREQVKAALQPLGVNFIDFTDGLTEKNPSILYHKTDTHWNNEGSFIGYSILMNNIRRDFPAVNVRQLSDYTKEAGNTSKRDLTKMLREETKETAVVLTSKYKTAAIQMPSELPVPANFTGLKVNYEKRYKNESGTLKVLVFGDSFFGGILSFFIDSFHETVLVSTIYNMDVVNSEKPDIVIIERIERDIDLLKRLRD